jgi:hypothetical protein
MIDPRKALSFLVNELEPRCVKAGVRLDQSPVSPKLARELLELEASGAATRAHVREALDFAFEVLCTERRT